MIRMHAVLALAALALAAWPARAQIDFGDHTSSTLTTKAWEALGRGDIDATLTYVNKCISMYEAEAKAMQASLSGFVPTEPREGVFEYWALNDVGTCYFIKGEALLKRGDTAGAKAAFDTVVNQFGYAQCWDTRGWFWKPADAAKQKSVELEFDAASGDWPDS